MDTERKELESYLASLNAPAAPVIMDSLGLVFHTIETGKLPLGSRADLIKEEIRHAFVEATGYQAGDAEEKDLGSLEHKTRWDEQNFWRTMDSRMRSYGCDGQLCGLLKRKYAGIVSDVLNGNEQGLRSALEVCLFGKLETAIRGTFPANAARAVVDALVENAKEAVVVYVALALRKPSAAATLKPIVDLCLRFPVVCQYGDEISYYAHARRLTLAIFHG